ncbi:K-box region and MADS-box transcription factor family protein isoform X4 [Carex rostrata]
MGRGKIEIRRIENSSNRQVTFSKRKNGIIKKAREISVLCDCTVSIVIFSSSGKLFEFCSPSTTLPALLEKYQNNSGKKLWDAKHESLSAEIERIRKENDNMQIELRHLRGEDINSLQPQELIAIEASLEAGVEAVRASRMKIWEELKRRTSRLEKEHNELCMKWHKQMPIDANLREMDLSYYHVDREFPPQIPMAFRVQPSHPNLQDN